MKLRLAAIAFVFTALMSMTVVNSQANWLGMDASTRHGCSCRYR